IHLKTTKHLELYFANIASLYFLINIAVLTKYNLNITVSSGNFISFHYKTKHCSQSSTHSSLHSIGDFINSTKVPAYNISIQQLSKRNENLATNQVIANQAASDQEATNQETTNLAATNQ
ncbi:20874_t:CDS:2, partial [Racocetra persica]